MAKAAKKTVGSTITVRRPGFDFSAVPRHWFSGNAVATHLSNGLNLLFPAGERFFVRSVRYYSKLFANDPELLEAVRGFVGQEVRHGLEHEKFFEVLRAQGFAIEPYLKAYEAFAFGFIERISPPKLRLSVTAAAEHFTAMFAGRALTENVLDGAHPVLRDLLRWHAAEELEHRSVAFDVLQRVDPSYALRIAGMMVATPLLVGFWIAATTMLLAQDRAAWPQLLADLRRARENGMSPESELREAFFDYFRRDFDPKTAHDGALAASYFAAHPIETAA